MKVALAGEAMLEFHCEGGGSGLHYGGDTLNTAIHMARMGCDVAYMTALGRDMVSEAMAAAWAREGLDTRLLLRHPHRQPGIYAIHVDAEGERSFLYWRDQSAARDMFTLDGAEAACEVAGQADLFCFSHISLAILPEGGRERMLDVATRVRARGGHVAYDSNFRPRLWDSLDVARHWSNRAMAVTSIGLPTGDDERALFESSEDDTAIAARWIADGCDEVVVKSGVDGCVLSVGAAGPELRGCARIIPVDSSGAGDAFNAGYLAARVAGLLPPAACDAGQALAAWVLTRRGALPARDSAAPYPPSAAPRQPIGQCS